MLMIVGELEQLTDATIMTMIEKLKLHLTEDEASDDFLKQITKAENNLYRRFDNWLHVIKHEKK